MLMPENSIVICTGCGIDFKSDLTSPFYLEKTQMYYACAECGAPQSQFRRQKSYEMLLRVYGEFSYRDNQAQLDAAEWAYSQLTIEICRGALPLPISYSRVRYRFYKRFVGFFSPRRGRGPKIVDSDSDLLESAEILAPKGFEIRELVSEVLRAWLSETAPIVLAHDVDGESMSTLGTKMGRNRFRISDELCDERNYISRKGEHLMDFAEEYLVSRGSSYSVVEAVIVSLMLQMHME